MVRYLRNHYDDFYDRTTARSVVFVFIVPLMVFVRILKRIISRPSLWTGIVALIAYWDNRALHGSYVYDDAGE